MFEDLMVRLHLPEQRPLMLFPETVGAMIPAPVTSGTL